VIRLIKWLAVAVLILLSILFYTLPGYSFSGLVCAGIAAVILGYNLIGLLSYRHFKAAKILKTVLTCLLTLGIMVVALTEIPIIKAANGQPQENCDYVVVLGAGLLGSSPSPILQSRIDRAIVYLTEHPDAICIASGGKGDDEAISEAQCIYEHLIAAGIDKDRIWLEDKSTSTWENFRFTLNIIEEKRGARPEKLAVISNDFHLFRAGMFAKDCGITAIGVPAETPSFPLKLNYYLREAAGVWHYFILGGQYHD
jgi:uncharacterized SAM-binding protein YcdF (DUF218 family)